MGSKVYRVFFIIVLGLGGALAGCQEEATSTPEPDRITLQLNWYHEAEFAGYYVADAKGFYADENLQVTINPGGIEVEEVQMLLDEETDFVVLGSNEYQTIWDSAAEPVVTAAVFQIAPLVLFALSDSGIQAPQDMIGRRVAIKTSEWQTIIHQTLHNAGADPAGIEEVEVEYDAIEKLYDGEVDVWSGYVHDEPTQAKLAGYDVNLIFPGDYGVGFYEGLLIVRQEMLDENPDLAARFLRASLRGWQYAVEQPDEAAEIILEWQPDESLEFHQIAMHSLLPLVSVGGTPIGWIDAGRWQSAIGDAYDAAQPGYTMQFVQAQE